MKVSRRILLLALMITAVAAMFALAACNDDHTPTSDSAGIYYISVYENGVWKNYSTAGAVPVSDRFTQDDRDKKVYHLTIDLDKGASVKIAQVGSSATYGGDKLFSALTVLGKGADNAIVVGKSGTFEFTFDTNDNTIMYKFTEKGEPPTGDPEILFVEIDGIGGSITLNHTQTKQLTATVTFDDGTDSRDNIEWESSDTSVATVGADGLVTPISAGTTKITAKSGDVESDSITVNVNGAVTLDETSIALNIGASKKITATAVGGATTGAWSSNNESIATVDADGTITAIAAGETTVRLVYFERPGSPKFADCAVRVNTPVSSVALSSTAVSVAIGGTDTLTVTIAPENASIKDYTYTVSDGGEEFVDVTKADNKLTVNGLKAGSATITVKSVDGQKEAQCAVTVVADGVAVVNLTSGGVNVNKLKLNTYANKTASLSVTVSNATVKSVAWTSSESGVATVGGSGESATVTAAGFGMTTITATVTLEGGDVVAKTCDIAVAPSNFFIYGDYEPVWSTDLSALGENGLVLEETAQGIYSIDIDLEKDKNFRIGHDDNFVSGYVGLGYAGSGNSFEHMTAGATDNNIKAQWSGNYTITVDITGAAPRLIIVCNSLVVDDIEIELTEGDSILKAGDTEADSATVTLTVYHENAKYEASDIVWKSNSQNVEIIPAADGLSVTVTAKETAANDNNVIITCTLNGISKTLNFSVVAKGLDVIAVETISFTAKEYFCDVKNGWNVPLSISVNPADATNNRVHYTSDSSIDFSGNTATGSRLGTFTITAIADGNPTATDTATVTFYSSQMYLIGINGDWKNVWEEYTFKADDNDNKIFTVSPRIAAGKSFKIAFKGIDTDWDGAITSAHLLSDSDAVDGGEGNIKVLRDGFYIITVDLSDDEPTVNVVYDAGAVTGISLTSSKTELRAGETDGRSATLTLGIEPFDATKYELDDIVWNYSVDKSGVAVTFVVANDKKTATVTIGETTASGFVTVTCAINGYVYSKSVTITIFDKDVVIEPVSSISFDEKSYVQDVKEGVWTTTVHASVDDGATNKDVIYSYTGSSTDVSVDAQTGEVTATKLGKYVITATSVGINAAGNAVTTTVTVTFYSSQMYLIGIGDNWVPLEGSSTKDSDFEHYTFTHNDDLTDDDYTVFTLTCDLEAWTKFKVLFCGTTSWDNAIGYSSLVSGSDAVESDNNNIQVDRADKYVITIDLSAADADITVKRVVSSATLKGGETEIKRNATTTDKINYAFGITADCKQNVEYTIAVDGASGTLATVTDASIFTGNGANAFENADGAFKCITAGKYIFDVLYDYEKGECTVIVSLVPEKTESNDYTMFVTDRNGGSKVQPDDAKLYVDNSEYTFCFSVTLDNWYNFKLAIFNAAGTAKVSDITTKTVNSDGFIFVDYTGEIAPSVEGNWGHFYPKSESATLYFEIVFTVDGSSVTVKSMTVSFPSSDE